MRLPLFILIALLLVLGAFFGWDYYQGGKVDKKSVGQIEKIREKPLQKYTYDTLSGTNFASSGITFGEIIGENAKFTSRYFFFLVDGKKVSGLINIPVDVGDHPVVVMFRGYVDRDEYKTGIGTQRAGEVFATNGFITLAPDFLGYGGS